MARARIAKKPEHALTHARAKRQELLTRLDWIHAPYNQSRVGPERTAKVLTLVDAIWAAWGRVKAGEAAQWPDLGDE